MILPMWISRFISIQLDESARRLECGNARRCSVLAGNAGSQHVNFAQRALPARRLKCGVALSRSQSLTAAHSRSHRTLTHKSLCEANVSSAENEKIILFHFEKTTSFN